MSIEIYQEAKSIISGGSRRGNSFYEVAANCGHQRYLANIASKEPRTGPQPDWAVRGVYYHLLQQWWHDGRADGTIELVPQDECWNDAVTLHNWYREKFTRDYWGKLIATELSYPDAPEDQALVGAAFDVPADDAPTMRMDMLVELSADDCDRIFEDRGLMLLPGHYILDWKHGKQHNADDEAKFTKGVQPTLYLTLGQFKWKPRGAIYVKTSMTKEKGVLKLKDTSFRIYVAHFNQHMELRSKSMIKFAHNSMLARAKNGGSVCNACPFFEKECFGY